MPKRVPIVWYVDDDELASIDIDDRRSKVSRIANAVQEFEEDDKPFEWLQAEIDNILGRT